MKVINKFLILLMLAVPFVGFAGCSDDDDDPVEVKSIAGDYKGIIKMGSTAVVNNATISVAYVSDTKVTLSMNENIPLGESSQLPISALPVNVSVNCDVKVNGNTVEIQKGTSNIELDLSGTGTPIPVPVTISGTIDDSGTANLTISLSIPTGTIPLPISTTFEGTKQK